MSSKKELTLELTPELLADRPASDTPVSLRLGGEGAAEVEIPCPILELILRTLARAAAGKRVRLVEEDDEVSPEKAAEFLRVSRPYLVKKLEEGEIPFHFVGTHRRIAIADLIEYKRRRRARSLEALRQMREEAEEMGLYE
jgi:excisionase family DNA binding protein